jgi:hypothetical protein
MTDFDLLREFSESRSETAFAELVHRLCLVGSWDSYRQTGDAHLADEVTQAVFHSLARKSGFVSTQGLFFQDGFIDPPVLAASDLVKTERRRNSGKPWLNA